VHPKSKRRFVVQSIEGGGWGGRPFEDGESGTVSVCQGDVRNGSIEGIELKCPVLVEGRSLRTDSGGAGRYRGGLGIDMRVRNLVEGKWNFELVRRNHCPPWGLWGGKPGEFGIYLLREPGESEFRAMGGAHHPVPVNAEVIVRTGGGGGWGDPLEREPGLVARDVIEGKVSLVAARGEYGVVLVKASTPAEFEVDFARTAKLREELRARCGGAPLAMIDRGEGYEQMLREGREK
jgi:N-methylhydantoinase B